MKQALITGGARGIGFGIAEAILAAGYQVTVTGLSDAEVAAVPKGENLRAVRLDVTDDADVARCIAGLTRLDALVSPLTVSGERYSAQANLEVDTETA